MDLRKWIEQDGFDTNFLIRHADEADETTVSMVTESSQSEEGSDTMMQVETEEKSQPEPPLQQEPQSTSTPLPSEAMDKECISSILDTLRELSISMEDMKAESEAIASKVLLQKLELDKLRVRKTPNIVTKIIIQKLVAVRQDSTDDFSVATTLQNQSEKIEKAFKMILKCGKKIDTLEKESKESRTVRLTPVPSAGPSTDSALSMTRNIQIETLSKDVEILKTKLAEMSLKGNKSLDIHSDNVARWVECKFEIFFKTPAVKNKIKQIIDARMGAFQVQNNF